MNIPTTPPAKRSLTFGEAEMTSHDEPVVYALPTYDFLSLQSDVAAGAAAATMFMPTSIDMVELSNDEYMEMTVNTVDMAVDEYLNTKNKITESGGQVELWRKPKVVAMLADAEKLAADRAEEIKGLMSYKQSLVIWEMEMKVRMMEHKQAVSNAEASLAISQQRLKIAHDTTALLKGELFTTTKLYLELQQPSSSP